MYFWCMEDGMKEMLYPNYRIGRITLPYAAHGLVLSYLSRRSFADYTQHVEAEHLRPLEYQKKPLWVCVYL
jgi:hypothetical protein